MLRFATEYKPYKNREVIFPISPFVGFLYLMLSCVSLGILVMPGAYKDIGYVLGVILNCFLAFILLTSTKILLRAMFVMCTKQRVPALSYPRALEAAIGEGPPCLHKFGAVFRWISFFLLFMLNFGLCCVYVIFVAKTLQQIVMEVYASNIDLRFYILAIVVPLFLFLLYATGNYFFFVVTISALGQVFVICSLFYHFYRAGITGDNTRMFGEWEEAPRFYGTCTIVCMGLGMILYVERHLTDPEPFPMMLNVTILLVLIQNISLGFVGYWTYGESVRRSITRNLPNEPLAIATKAVIAANMVVSYNLQFFSALSAIWDNVLVVYAEQYNWKRYEAATRPFIILFTAFFAMIFPSFSDFLAFMGSFFVSFVAIVLPSCMDLCIRYPEGYGKCRFYLIRDVFLISVGVICGIVSSYFNLSRVISILRDGTQTHYM